MHPRTKLIGGFVVLGVFTFLGMNFTVIHADDKDVKQPAEAQRGLLYQLVNNLMNLYRDKDILLPDPAPPPFQKPYTLVIDPKLLLYSEWEFGTGWRYLKRPGVDIFLATMAQYYEIILFSEEYFIQSGPIYERLDPQQNYFSYKLFKDSLVSKNGVKIKDLTRMNRDLGHIILLDDKPWNLENNPDNSFFLAQPDGTNMDTSLLDATPFLIEIVTKNYDVRAALRHCRETDLFGVRDSRASFIGFVI